MSNDTIIICLSSFFTYIFLAFLNTSETFNGRQSIMSSNGLDSESFMKQSLIKLDKKKVYRSKIKIDLDKNTVLKYILNIQNRHLYNKYLKDIIIITDDIETSIQYQIYDFKLLSKNRDFLVIESQKNLKIGDKTFNFLCFNSLENEFNYKCENSERAKITSSGYFVTDTENLNQCLLGFWIESEVTHDENLQEHVMKDFITHIKKIKDNLLFDILK